MWMGTQHMLALRRAEALGTESVLSLSAITLFKHVIEQDIDLSERIAAICGSGRQKGH